MSELNTTNYTGDFRLGLMTTACALALLASAAGADGAKAEDADRPTVWIELGGQIERVDGTGDRFIAPFMTIMPTPEPYKFAPPLDAVRAPRYAVGGEGKISFEPEGSNWVFSAAVRYGRSNGSKTSKHQTLYFGTLCVSANLCAPGGTGGGAIYAQQFAKTFAKHNESHSILDFAAGKDVGLGMFGGTSRVTMSAGVRYAQFQARSSVNVYAAPHVEQYNAFPFTSGGFPYFPGLNYNSYRLIAHSTRSFHGIGPSVSLSGSSAIAGNRDKAEFDVEWGANAALLFGRQRSNIYHYTSAVHGYKNKYTGNFGYSALYPARSKALVRSRSVTVPNVGGFAAISLKFPNAKVSLGYRGDFFFGANDVGIDARKEDTLSFHGPYATISIGLGG